MMPQKSINKYDYKIDIFKNLENFYYVLGAFCSDGCVDLKSHRMFLASKDIDWLNILSKYFCNDLRILNHSGSNNCKQIAICNKFICENFYNNGCTPNKSKNLKFPNIPEKYLPDFIRGCIDGDGCVTIDKNGKYLKPSIYLCSSSLKFITEFNNKLNDKNIKYCHFEKIEKAESYIFDRKITRTCPHYRTKIMGKQNILNFVNWIWYDNHIMNMPRKYNKINEIRHLIGEDFSG